MGKGDKKSKRGKIFRKSYGKSRPRKLEQSAPVAAEVSAAEKPKAKSRAKKATA